MNRYTIHSIAKNIIRSIENNDKDEKIFKGIRVLAGEIQDPFVSSIDDFLIEKQKKDAGEKTSDDSTTDQDTQDNEEENKPTEEGNPQEDAKDELKEEAIDYKEPVEQDHPQEDAKDELKEEAIDYKEPVEQDHPQEDAKDELKEEAIDYKEPVEQDHPQEDAQDELKDELKDETSEDEEDKDAVEHKKDEYIESALRKLGNEIEKRGHSKLAARFIMASSAGILEIMNNLLRKEFLIRDILENYCYLFSPEAAVIAKNHKPKDSILYLQKQLLSLGGVPTTQRLVIPAINPASSEGVLALVKEHESNIIADYLAAIKSIEKEDKYLTLKIMFMKIVNAKSQLRNEV